MKKVVIISGHPDLKTSVANATILEEVSQALPEVEIRRLDTLYPDYNFNIEAEQTALLHADLIIWQFPFSWYSVPGLMKLWIDKVFLHGFSHGSQGKLAGKKLLLSFTTGAPEVAYSRDGVFSYRVDDYLPQFETTATLCNLELQPSIYTNGISYTSRDNEDILKAQYSAAKDHATRLIATIKALAS